MASFSYDVKIPKDRIAVLIGKNGKIKKEIEEATHSTLDIDSKEGDVLVEGDDPLMLFATKNIIRAIARGFNPDIALRLLTSDYLFELVEIKHFVKNQGHILRLKGRVIGKGGKTREIIEEMSDCNMCVYGKTIGVIGPAEKVGIARKAIESLLLGSPHATVYKWLEKQKKRFVEENILSKRKENSEE